MGYYPIDYREPIYPDQTWYCPHCHAENLDNPATMLLMCRECNAVDLDWSEVLPELPAETAANTARTGLATPSAKSSGSAQPANQ